MLKIFIINDEYFERQSLIRNINWSSLDIKVSGEANNGLSAFETISKEAPDIAIVDINMPKMNGLDLISLLNENNISCKYIILTGYDEFEYAQKAIKLNVFDYILKPINYENLEKCLRNLSAQIYSERQQTLQYTAIQNENRQLRLERYYNDLINCNFSSSAESDLYAIEAEASPLAIFANYRVAVCALTDFNSIVQLNALKEHLQNLYTNQSIVICQDLQQRLFFIFSDDNLQTDLSAFIDSLYTLISSQGLPCMFGIGSSYSQIQQIYLSYNEACIASQNCMIRNTNILFYNEIHRPLVQVFDAKKKNIICSLIGNQSLNKIENFFSSLYNDFCHQKLPWDIILLHTIELVNILSETLNRQTKLSVSFFQEENILSILNQKKNIAELQDWITNLYITSINRFLASPQYSNVTRCVEAYIEKNYSDSELSINTISKALFLNYSYLCYCFKRDKNTTINEYLTQFRINKAIELLKNKTENITYVAEKTGFTSASYFSKQFKKITGITPSEYSKKSHYLK